MLSVAATLQYQMRKHASLLQGALTPSERRVATAFVQAPQDYFDAAPTFKQSYAPQSGEIFGVPWERSGCHLERVLFRVRMASALQRAGCDRYIKLPESRRTVARRTPRRGTPVDRGEPRSCPKIVEDLPSSCRTVAPGAKLRPDLGQVWPTLGHSAGKSWPTFGQHLTGICPHPAIFVSSFYQHVPAVV